MKTFIYFIVPLLISTTCMNYKSTPGFRLHGAEIKTESKYSSFSEGYCVYAYFVPNVDISTSTTKSDTFMEEITNLTSLCLIPGHKSLLYFYGCDTTFYPNNIKSSKKLYYWFYTPPTRTYELIILVDSLKQRDTIILNSSKISIIEYQYNHNAKLNYSNGANNILIAHYKQNGYSTNLNGYLYINTLSSDSIIGILSFKGIAKGFYYNETDDFLIPDLESNILSTIIFTAARKKINKINFSRILTPDRYIDDYYE